MLADFEYPYRVVLDTYFEWENHQQVVSWLCETFGSDNNCVTWRPALSGTPSTAHPLFSTYMFVHEEDAALFALRWL
jgi:hypothetical protein